MNRCGNGFAERGGSHGVSDTPEEPPDDASARWPHQASLAEVRTIAAPHPAVIAAEQLAAQCRMSQLRRSGPGGQHRNKVSTAISWRHEPTGIAAEASESRDQTRNRQEALRRLRLRLAIRLRTAPQSDHDDAVRDATDRACRGTWRQRKLKISGHNDDLPAVLALVLDDLHRAGGQPSLVGPLWQASTTAVVSLIASHPAALQEVNRWREHHGRRPLSPRRGS